LFDVEVVAEFDVNVVAAGFDEGELELVDVGVVLAVDVPA